MKYSLCLALALLSPLMARENPFLPMDEAKKQKVTSNIPDARPRIGTVSYTFPDQARVLKEVTFTIQNLDGSFEEKKVPIDQSIDWHRPITISQGGVSTPSAAKSVSAANFGFIRLFTKGKNLTLKSADPLVRHFALSDPNQIVLDFKHTTPFKSDQKPLNAAPYTNVSIGNHGEFARVTITLDGRYSYSLDKSSGLISITCN
ncbi:AMIN domain-containing protein [Sulfuricurvum sp.]|uniref:AMIN domain-containing protein n=1 Tax=Sulfuricurvum sp. TaxID=2025608 RepID=UPI002E336164|nr:AMIN domain-containing protein [Sulfuricurvum sp.]HEX5329698.1 AMIN domain-containing protein [Sulfuricurvum sp.]